MHVSALALLYKMTLGDCSPVHNRTARKTQLKSVLASILAVISILAMGPVAQLKRLASTWKVLNFLLLHIIGIHYAILW